MTRRRQRRTPPPSGLRRRLLPPLLLAASLLLTSPLSGQLRREGVVPYPVDAPGRVLIGLGGGLSGDASFPLSGLQGRLALLGSVTLAYNFAPGAVFLVRGDAVRLLSVEGEAKWVPTGAAGTSAGQEDLSSRLPTSGQRIVSRPSAGPQPDRSSRSPARSLSGSSA